MSCSICLKTNNKAQNQNQFLLKDVACANKLEFLYEKLQTWKTGSVDACVEGDERIKRRG